MHRDIGEDMVTPMVGGHWAGIGQLLVQPIEASHGVTEGRPRLA